MKNKRIIFSIVFAAAMLLTACEEEEKPLRLVPITGTSEPSQTTATTRATKAIENPAIRDSIIKQVAELRQLSNEVEQLEDEYQTYLEAHGGSDNLTEDQIYEAMSMLEKIIATHEKLIALVENLPKDLNSDEEEYLVEVLKEIQ